MTTLRLIARNRLALVGGIVLLAIVLLALVTPWLPLQLPNVTNTAHKNAWFGEEGHLLGADDLGRDLLSRLLWGTRTSLAIGFASAAVAAVLGAAIGIVAGYVGGRLDNLLMRVIDMLMGGLAYSRTTVPNLKFAALKRRVRSLRSR